MAWAHAFYRLNFDFTETSGGTVRRTYRLNPAVVTTDAGAATAFSDVRAQLVLLSDSVINQGQWEDFLGNFLPGGQLVVSDGDTMVDGTFSGRRRNVHSLGT